MRIKEHGFGSLILLILFSSQLLSQHHKQLKDYPAYVSDSPSPTGVKAFYTYLDNE